MIAFLLDSRGKKLKLNLRIVEKNDCERIFEIRNSPEVRSNSFRSEEINYPTHEKWLADSLLNPNRCLYAIECDESLIGVVRFDVLKESATVSIYIAHTHRSIGAASFGLTEGEKVLCKAFPQVTKIIAEVKSSNETSLRLFNKCEYKSENIILSKEITR